jgi:PAS domain S-box
MRPGRDRELLTETLSDRYRVETTTDVGTLESTFDCCVFDTDEFSRVAGTVQSRRELSAPAFLPFVLLVGDEATERVAESVWEYVDDVIELPVKRAALASRIDNLVQRRQTSLRLAERERKLEETVDDLQLKERAMDEAPVGITLAESGVENNPLVYTNAGFEEITGYASEAFGEDCRFLQGPETSAETKATIREALDTERPVSVDILNYRANDQTFWNGLTIAPLRDDDGAVTHYVGFQTDITDRKIRERRLEVMNRVLNHNLRNKMNLIEGHAELLRQDIDDEDALESLEVIAETTAGLMSIAESVRKVDYTLSTAASTDTAVELNERLPELVSRFTDQYPDANIELSLPDDDPLEVNVVGVMTAIREGIENAIKHNDAPTPQVEVRVRRPSEGWTRIEIEDDGPGIPDRETEVLSEGETALNHADRLGIWLMYWVVNKAGGSFSVATPDSGGTVVRLLVPVAP